MTAFTLQPGLAPPRAAIQYCQELTRQHSHTFYLGSWFFPAQQRQAVWAVYAACRTGDDLADLYQPEQARLHLEAWWAGIQAAYQGRAAADPVSQALAWAVSTYPVPLSALAELHEGLRMDLVGHEYRDLNDLKLYCRRVAGVVGLMIAPISGYRAGPATLERAMKLGEAMQLTNILRDVGEDLQRGRVYLPQNLMAQYGVTRADLERGLVTPQYRALIWHLSCVAREWYAEGRAGISQLDGSARLAVDVAARAYEGILDDLARHDFNNFSRRAHVSSSRKLFMLPRAWWELRLAQQNV